MTKRTATSYWPLLAANGLFFIAIGLVVGDWFGRTANAMLLANCFVIMLLAAWYSSRLSRRRSRSQDLP